MREVGAFEAKTKFGQLLDWVEASDELVIARRGKIVARLVPPGVPPRSRGEPRRCGSYRIATTPHHFGRSVLRLSDIYRLTIYDASYLELALRLNLPLATLDRDPRAAGETAGSQLLGL